MSSAEQAELNIAREHRLHRAPGDDVDQLRLEIVFAEDALLFGDPQRHRVAADSAVGKQELQRRFSRMRSARPKPTRKNRRQPSTLHACPPASKRLELFLNGLNRLLHPPSLTEENLLCLLSHTASVRVDLPRQSVGAFDCGAFLNCLEPALEIGEVI